MTWQPNKLEAERVAKADELEAEGVVLFPARVQRTHTAAAGRRRRVVQLHPAQYTDVNNPHLLLRKPSRPHGIH